MAPNIGWVAVRAVVNTPARSATGVAKCGSTLGSSLPELGRVLIGLLAINRHRDGIELLKDFMDAVPECRVHVLRHLYFGDESKFELYDASKAVRPRIESRGGKALECSEYKGHCLIASNADKPQSVNSGGGGAVHGPAAAAGPLYRLRTLHLYMGGGDPTGTIQSYTLNPITAGIMPRSSFVAGGAISNSELNDAEDRLYVAHVSPGEGRITSRRTRGARRFSPGGDSCRWEPRNIPSEWAGCCPTGAPTLAHCLRSPVTRALNISRSSWFRREDRAS